MLKKIIKRNGQTEDLIPSKLNKWSQWAAKSLGERVDWSSIVMDVVRKSPEVVSSQELQMSLIKECISRNTFAYNFMAGRLYAPLLKKQIFGDNVPTVKEHFTRLKDMGIMEEFFYTEQQWQEINDLIDHDRDMSYAYFQIKHISRKYSLKDSKTSEPLETPQFTFMRKACALANELQDSEKMELLKGWYNAFSKNKINSPTPNYINLGTHHRGLASCCLYTTSDTAASLAIGDHIAYTMTYMSAGIGSHINTRSIGDKVRSGQISHQGKLPYYRAMAAAVGANMQGGRGGACTSYYSLFDPEAETITMLQNPRSTEDKRNRDIHFAAQSNAFFAKKAARGEDVFTFNAKSAPDLMEAFFSNDISKFEALYNKYEQDPTFEKKYVSARKLIRLYKEQTFEVGTLYHAAMDEINRHTPFEEPIYSSNLCVAPNTKILTKEHGYVRIRDVSGKSVHVWNGENWSLTTPVKTSEKSEMVTVLGNFGTKLSCTPYHRFAVVRQLDTGEQEIVDIEAQHLQRGDRLIDFKLSPCNHGNKDSKLMEHDKIPSNEFSFKDRLTWFLSHLYTLSRSHNTTSFSSEHYFGVRLRDTLVMDSKQRKREFIELKLFLQELGIRSRVSNFQRMMITTIVINTEDFAKVLDFEEHGPLVDLLQLMPGNYPKSMKDNVLNPDELESIVGVLSEENLSSTYCFTENERNMGMFAGALTKQCLEITEPTAPYERMEHLYSEYDHGSVLIEVNYSESERKKLYYLYNDRVMVARKGKDNEDKSEMIVTFAGNIQDGDSVMGPASGKYIYHNAKVLSVKRPGEVALCSLAAIVEPNIESDEEYEQMCYLALRMIDICIHKADYALPHVGYTAKQRLNAAVGLVGAATSMARAGLPYSSSAGKRKIHEMSERHSYFTIKASSRLGKELGVAPWMHKTKWPKGWLPIDTYNKNVDSIVPNDLKRDWQALREEIVANGGIRNSCLVAHMPTETSSKGSGMPNGWYPIRSGVLMKTDGTNVIEWCAHDYDLLAPFYELAYDISTTDMLEVYAVIQKFTDHAISADLYKDRVKHASIGTTEMLLEYFNMMKYGVKTTYYQNSLTNKEDVSIGLSGSGCPSGACTI